MSLTQPPPPDPADDIDRPPSRTFRILFGTAIVIIAIGYMWVWQVKTSRVVIEPPPVLALVAATANDSRDEHLESVLHAALDTIPSLTVIVADSSNAAAAGATQLLYAELHASDAGHELAMRRTDLEGDSLLHTYRVNGRTVDDAAYRMAVQLAMSLGLPRPQPPGETR